MALRGDHVMPVRLPHYDGVHGTHDISSVSPPLGATGIVRRPLIQYGDFENASRWRNKPIALEGMCRALMNSI
jgi:hypothetical protein